MAFYQFTQTQKIPASLDVVWDFISSPGNLKQITPPYMGFEVTGNSGSGKMYPGMIITYIVRPLFGIPLKWMTEITHVADRQYFVDEQRMGPYTLWHHEHKVEAIAGGVLMTDMVTYIPPFGILGALANRLLIRKKLQQIFEFRTQAIVQQFGLWK
ncbi:MAG: SRPBCC family protein [Chitinophagales bacterium]